MTEADWLCCSDPTAMLATLPATFGERKRRLFAVACCRRIWHLLKWEESRQAVHAAERYAEGTARERELATAQYFASRAIEEHGLLGSSTMAAQAATNTAERSLAWANQNEARSQFDPAWAAAVAVGAHAGQMQRSSEGRRWSLERAVQKERSSQSDVLRDMAGNPFHLPLLEPIWLTWNDACVAKIAQVIYDAEAFDRLPILADALEDAGCDNADILAHCRGPGPHVRGCWVVDLLLGKS